MAKSIFAVTLLEDALVTRYLGAQEVDTGVLEDGSVSLRLGLATVFEIAKNNNSGFSSVGFTTAIGFDDEDTHRRQGLGDCAFLAESKICLLVDAF